MSRDDELARGAALRAERELSKRFNEEHDGDRFLPAAALSRREMEMARGREVLARRHIARRFDPGFSDDCPSEQKPPTPEDLRRRAVQRAHLMPPEFWDPK